MKSKSKRKSKKLTTGAKITLAAFSLIGFAGSWNIIGHWENEPSQGNQPLEAPPAPPVVSTLTADLTLSALPSPTPWPTIAPMPILAPIPTLISNALPTDNITTNIGLEPLNIQIVLIPTLAPLPEMSTPPAPASNGGGDGNQSGGS